MSVTGEEASPVKTYGVPVGDFAPASMPPARSPLLAGQTGRRAYRLLHARFLVAAPRRAVSAGKARASAQPIRATRPRPIARRTIFHHPRNDALWRRSPGGRLPDLVADPRFDPLHRARNQVALAGCSRRNSPPVRRQNGSPRWIRRRVRADRSLDLSDRTWRQMELRRCAAASDTVERRSPGAITSLPLATRTGARTQEVWPSGWCPGRGEPAPQPKARATVSSRAVDSDPASGRGDRAVLNRPDKARALDRGSEACSRHTGRELTQCSCCGAGASAASTADLDRQSEGVPIASCRAAPANAASCALTTLALCHGSAFGLTQSPPASALLLRSPVQDAGVRFGVAGTRRSDRADGASS
jgi:hypothetical protein